MSYKSSDDWNDLGLTVGDFVEIPDFPPDDVKRKFVVTKISSTAITIGSRLSFWGRIKMWWFQ